MTRLLDEGLAEGRTAGRAIGYREVAAYLSGELTLDEAREQTTTATRRFARRQDSWFRKDPRITWVRYDDPDRVELALTAITGLSKIGRASGGRLRGRLIDMTETAGRDRLRELLDAVLDEDNQTLGDMAGGAYSSPYHFSRQLSRGAREAPVAMRRRVMLERAAWQIRQGTSVTDAAFAAGYESVEGFSRAFARAYGHPPSDPVRARRPLAPRAQRHPLPPAHLAVGPHHGAPDEPTHRTAGRPGPRRHPRPAGPRQAAARRRLPRDPPVRGARCSASTAPTSRSRRC